MKNDNQNSHAKTEESKANWFGELLMKFVPDDQNIEGKTPESMIRNSSLLAGSISGIAALPPGPLGWITILPELIAVTKVQMNLIYKIAKYYNQENKVNELTITHVFARFTGIETAISNARKEVVDKMTDVAIKEAGHVVVKNAIQKAEAYIIKNVSKETLKETVRKISLKISAMVTSKVFGRLLIGLAAFIFGTLSYKNTKNIGKVAQELFSKPIIFEDMEQNRA